MVTLKNITSNVFFKKRTGGREGVSFFFWLIFVLVCFTLFDFALVWFILVYFALFNNIIVLALSWFALSCDCHIIV